VRWPAYQTQVIPASAATLELVLTQGAETIKTLVLDRAQSTATFSRIPVGTYTLSAWARRSDAARTSVAMGSASVTIRANQIARPTLTMTPALAPRLDYLYPSKGLASRAIFLYGENLVPPPGGTYSVTVDGRPVPSTLLQPPSTTYLVVTELPPWAGATSSFALSVDGVVIPKSQERVFTRQVLHHVTVMPSIIHLASGSVRDFTVTAWADAGESEVLDLPATWSLHDADPADAFALTPWGTLTCGPSTGSVTLQAWIGGMVGTASVTVD
jgi:hypothetical protein